MRNHTLLSLLLILAACGGGDTGGDDDGPACTSGHCGNPRTRRAIPTAQLALIHLPGSARRLEAEAPAWAATVDYVNDVDDDVAAILDDIAATTDSEPESEEDGRIVWREPDPDLDGIDDVLIITTSDDESYQVQLLVGPEGFDEASGELVIDGDLAFGPDDELDSFSLVVDFDALAVHDPGVTGTLTIAGHPFAGGEEELWYDFAGYHEDGDADPPLTSRTTFWAFSGDGEDDGALEYEDEEAIAYVRWDASGGRYDHQAVFDDSEWGETEEIHTECWDQSDAQTFDATAWFTAADDYAQLDGSEADCGFGPAADLPTPDPAFDDLPGEGEWETIDVTWLDCDADPGACP